MNASRIVHHNGHTIELRVDDRLAPAVLRRFVGSTPLDDDIDALPLPHRPASTRAAVRAVRWYRVRMGRRLGNRCVFEPSCSRYAELALRRYGVFKGIGLTVSRLWRCRPGLGGVDIP